MLLLLAFLMLDGLPEIEDFIILVHEGIDVEVVIICFLLLDDAFVVERFHELFEFLKVLAVGLMVVVLDVTTWWLFMCLFVSFIHAVLQS